MKTHSKIPFLQASLILVLGFIFTGRIEAQTFKILYNFTTASGSYPNLTNSDGAEPYASLVVAGNTLYGTASIGGISGEGSIFRINTDGTGFTNLHSFNYNDGAEPYAGLILSGSTLYGTTRGGGNSIGNGGIGGVGTVFKINTDGTGFTNLYIFPTDSNNSSGILTNSDGANPIAGLILSGGTLFGTTIAGGRSGYGTVFSVNTNGSSFTNLHSFDFTNDGANPYAGLILSGGTLFGTTSAGGSGENGSFFAITTNGTHFTNLYSFPGPYNGYAPTPSRLTLSGATLYATMYQGGTNNPPDGTVFAIHTNGTAFTNLYFFTAPTFANGAYSNNDGAYPNGPYPNSSLVLAGSMLYGTTSLAGNNHYGTIFAITTNGTSFTNLHSFAAHLTDGAEPNAGLVASGNTLYGTTVYGGNFGYGVIFSLSFGPHLSTITSGSNLILTWPTNAAGFTLQSNTNLASPNWTNISATPAVLNGQFTVTNPMSGARAFFRLSQ